MARIAPAAQRSKGAAGAPIVFILTYKYLRGTRKTPSNPYRIRLEGENELAHLWE